MAPQQPHFLLVAFPGQGHINPCLQLAERLLRMGARVTLSTCVSAQRHMARAVLPDGLSLATFSDGDDDGRKPKADLALYMAELRRRSSQSLRDLILRSDREGVPLTCIVYTHIQPWIAEVARDHHIPSALLWIQPATVFLILYHYFGQYGDTLSNYNEDPSFSVDLPGLPRLRNRDIPSYFSNGKISAALMAAFEEHMAEIRNHTDSRVLVNSFDLLEQEALTALANVKMIGIGPLVPSPRFEVKNQSTTTNDCLQWLRTNPEGSVVYVSFGSVCLLAKRQMEEIARGLIESGFPFLWVVREEQGRRESESESGSDDQLMGYTEELEKRGKIVPWCSQMEVLSNPAVGCFVTHCGWNSTGESMVCGVPVVAFPQLFDQGTNAKLIEDEWRTGVRVELVGEAEEGTAEVVVKGEEIRRCLDLVMSDGSEQRKNAKKWRDLAREAVAEGGSSDINLREFYESLT